MEIAFYVILGLVVVATLYGIVIYNGLVKLRESVKQAWSNIDVLLVQRHDELPKLVETCKRYMEYEQETLERVIGARNAVSGARESGDVAALGVAEGALRQSLGSLFALAEAYPDLKADASFRNLQERISALEEAIADRREFYNDSVNRNNVRIEQFPDILVARRFGFQAAQLLEFDASQTADVNIRELFE